MSRPEVTWGDASAFFRDHGFAVERVRRSGDARVIAPGIPGKRRLSHIVGHLHSLRKTHRLPHGHLQAFRRKFGVTPEHIAGAKPWSTDLLPEARAGEAPGGARG